MHSGSLRAIRVDRTLGCQPGDEYGSMNVIKSMNVIGDLSRWDVSNVRSMTKMFASSKILNSAISDWNVSQVTNTRGMFDGCGYSSISHSTVGACLMYDVCDGCLLDVSGSTR
jgi:surface protein